jgi:precorrin-6A/cobalt-precorrin-6A reductase
MARILVLAGTTEATALAGILHRAGHDVVSSFAGVTSSPRPRPGRVRSGGFGGAEGLASYLQSEAIDALVDATHPFAAVMPFHAYAACSATAVPYLRLERAPWTPGAEDRWSPVPDMEAAAGSLAGIGARRVFLAIGRQQLGAFTGCSQWFLVRSIEPVATALAPMVAIQDQGPFTVDGETDLLRRHRIDTVVAKNAGGDATQAKLDAARALRVTVVMVERPPGPPDATVVATVDEATGWVAHQSFSRQ